MRKLHRFLSTTLHRRPKIQSPQACSQTWGEGEDRSQANRHPSLLLVKAKSHYERQNKEAAQASTKGRTNQGGPTSSWRVGPHDGSVWPVSSTPGQKKGATVSTGPVSSATTSRLPCDDAQSSASTSIYAGFRVVASTAPLRGKPGDLGKFPSIRHSRLFNLRGITLKHGNANRMTTQRTKAF